MDDESSSSADDEIMRWVYEEIEREYRRASPHEENELGGWVGSLFLFRV